MNNDFFNEECIDKIRQQLEVINSLVAFTSEEAEAILYRFYSVLEDQIMKPVARGGVPGHIMTDEDSL